MKKSRVSIDMEKVRALTESRLWSWAELARKSGLSVSTIFSLQSGKRNSSNLTARKLAAALGVKPAEIIKEQE